MSSKSGNLDDRLEPRGLSLKSKGPIQESFEFQNSWLVLAFWALHPVSVEGWFKGCDEKMGRIGRAEWGPGLVFEPPVPANRLICVQDIGPAFSGTALRHPGYWLHE